ncbi:MAG: hypothetical protein ACXWOX_21275 [Ktedonobacteraceae bacterium]
MKPTDKVKVAVVIAACLIGLTVVLKNVLNIPSDVLSRDIILWIIIYSGFFIVLNFTEEEAPKEGTTARKAYDSPWLWSALIVGMTLAIIAVYAFA